MGGWVGSGRTLVPICAHCYFLYASVRTAFPDRPPEEILDISRLMYLNDSLPSHLRPKLRRLLILLQNDSRRAQRLVRMAHESHISIQQLLAII